MFAVPGQKRALTRTLTFGIRAPPDDLERPFSIDSNLERMHGRTVNPATLFQSIRVCVPREGSADVTFRTPEISTIYGDMRSESTVNEPRLGGLLLTEIGLADELGPPCQPRESPLMRRTLPILALWAGLAACLSVITTRVVDWFAMPNELLYERRAISVAQTLSPLPRVRDEIVSTFDQLYPVLVAPAFRFGGVPDDLWATHFLNAWIMSSACIPAFFLARRVTDWRWAPWVVAVLTVAMPWIFYSALVFTEVAAYPAFVWAIYAMQASTAAPSRRADLLALVAIGFAFFGRTQLAIMLFLLPAAIVAVELGRVRGVRSALRASLASHPLLVWAYGLLVAIGAVLALTGRLPGVLGVYGATIGGTGASVGERIVPSGFGGSFVEHLAVFSLGLGILPFVVGVAWLLANLVRPAGSRELHAFACLGALTVVAIFLEVTIFDLRFGERFVHDRYLFYLVPVIVLGFVCAVTDPWPPRWSLALPTSLVAVGFAVGELPRFTWEDYPQLNSDGPIYALVRPIVDMSGSLATARGALVVATVILSVLFVQAAILLRPRLFAGLAVGFVAVALPFITGYMLVRFFEVNGWSGRPLTSRPEPRYDWVDRAVGTARVVSRWCRTPSRRPTSSTSSSGATTSSGTSRSCTTSRLPSRRSGSRVTRSRRRSRRSTLRRGAPTSHRPRSCSRQTRSRGFASRARCAPSSPTPCSSRPATTGGSTGSRRDSPPTGGRGPARPRASASTRSRGSAAR